MRITMLLLSVALVSGCYKTNLFNPDGTGGYFCHILDDGTPEDHACPEGTACVAGVSGAGAGEGRCVSAAGGGGGIDMAGLGRIPKTGTYSGTHVDPGLNTIADCTDNTLEPNDTLLAAVKAPDVVPDMTPPKITKMAICPKGNRPDTGQHDEDYFKLDLTKSSTSLTMMAELFYDVTYGDLDIGIFDSTGRLVASDGTAIGGGCAAGTVTPGIYYVLVVGAGDVDTNRYDVRIRTYTGAKTCAVGDMGL